MNTIGPMRIPETLISMLSDSSLASVSDKSIRRALELSETNIEFVKSVPSLVSWGLRTSSSDLMGKDIRKFFGMYFQHECDDQIKLPVLNLDKTFFIGSGRRDGDDTWVGLNFNQGFEMEPCVVINRYGDLENKVNAGCDWRIVADTFDAFVAQLTIQG